MIGVPSIVGVDRKVPIIGIVPSIDHINELLISSFINRDRLTSGNGCKVNDRIFVKHMLLIRWINMIVIGNRLDPYAWKLFLDSIGQFIHYISISILITYIFI